MNCAAILERVSVSFDGRKVVREVSVQLPEQGISVLVGRSGCGKTTLLRSLNRLNEEFSGCKVTGRVLLDLGRGVEDIALRPLPELRRLVGMVFQSPNVFPVSVFRNIALPLQTVGECPRSEVEDRVRQALEDVGLWKEVGSRLNMPAERLSGGQQQRLCLARALALEPAMLLLDEPTASLDVHASALVEELLLRLASRYPLVMVSHSLGQALRLGTRVLVMQDGHISHELNDTSSLDENSLAQLMGVSAL